MRRNSLGKCVLVSLLCLCLSVVLGVLSLTCVCALPTGRMLTKAAESVPILEQEGSGFYWAPDRVSSRLDGFTDSIMMQTAVYPSTDSALKTAMLAPRMDFFGDNWSPTDSLIRISYGERGGTVSDYARYWNGYLIFLKPLMLFFSLSDIRMMNGTFQLCLAAAVLLLCFRERGLRLALPMGLALLSLNPISTALSMQYSSIYYLALISMLVMLLARSYEKDWGWMVFLFLGIGTAFFDFLTYPAAAVGLCLALEALLSPKTGKRQLLRSFGCGIAWAFGYGGMWASKWLVSMAVTGQNVLADALAQLRYRSSAQVAASEGGKDATFGAVLGRNLSAYLHPAAIVLAAVLLLLLLWLLLTRRCRFRPEKERLLPLALAFLTPFVWYFLVRNHSMIHYWMTHRALSAAIFALTAFFCFSLQFKQEAPQHG